MFPPTYTHLNYYHYTHVETLYEKVFQGLESKIIHYDCVSSVAYTAYTMILSCMHENWQNIQQTGRAEDGVCNRTNWLLFVTLTLISLGLIVILIELTVVRVDSCFTTMTEVK